MCQVVAQRGKLAKSGSKKEDSIGSVRKNSGGKRQAWYQSQVITGKCRSLSALVPVSLTTQVWHQ